MSPGALGLAYTLEALLGDPEGWPHPVRGLGWAIARGEAALRACVRSETLAGAVLTILIVGSSAGATILARSAVPPAWTAVFDGGVLYLSLAANQLLREGWNLRRLLRAGDLAAARANLARLVSRRTEDLGEEEISRAAIETMGENFSDGVVAPVFYFLVVGPAGAAAYKAVNTLDSMIGYRSARYLYFGRFAARLDDAANYLPARAAGAILAAAAAFSGFSPARAARTVWEDGAKHESPNAGIGKAAVAGALGVRLGGPARYDDGLRERPWIGERIHPCDADRIGEAVRLFLAACAVLAGLSFAAVLA